MMASNENKTECVRILAEKESGMKDEAGFTALMMAAYEGHV